MIIKDTAFTMKDDRKALLRSPKDEDIRGVLDYLYVSAGETEFILRYPEECGKYTYEGEKALFDRINASDNEAMLCASLTGRWRGIARSRGRPGLKQGTGPAWRSRC